MRSCCCFLIRKRTTPKLSYNVSLAELLILLLQFTSHADLICFITHLLAICIVQQSEKVSLQLNKRLLRVNKLKQIDLTRFSQYLKQLT